MKIRFLGHAAFLITTAGGAKIVTDPYEPGGFGGAIGYGPLTEPADVVVVSHDHADHNYVDMVPGKPAIVRGTKDQSVRGVAFRAVATHHDAAGGRERGENVVWMMEADDLRLCHLGDLGHTLTADQVAALGSVDVLMVPVGGTFTVDAEGATEVVNAVKPHIAIPMHYQTPKLGFHLASVDEFLAGKARVRRVGGPEIELTRETLPEPTEIVVLESAL
jgi:L-ascorbate metabolism protein UlaG (beta-lactamase superfamily)